MTVVDWLLDSDPSIRWQVMRDLTDAPAEEVAAERARVATEGAGARLLALQAADGRWGGAAWNRGWDSTMHVLSLLREMGLDPASAEARRAVGLVRDRVTWQGCGPPECDGNPFFAGEVEPCINGQVAASGAYFGQDVRGIVDRLLGEQLPDGGWNCEAANGSTRSSFNTTICVLEALLEHERAVGSSPEVTAARLRGQEYLLERRLFRRRSTGEVIERDRKGGAAWTRFAFPTWWHYDVLRGLDYLRRAGVAPDERVAEAIELVASKRDGDGRWPLETRYPGLMPVEIDEGEGRPSRWNTLRALRVLRWHERAGRKASASDPSRLALRSVGASPAAPLGGIRQHEQIQAGEQEQGEREQRRVGHPGGRLPLSHAQGDEVGDDGHRKGNGQPAVGLPNPVVPVHGILASRSTSFPPIIFQP